MSSKSDIIYSNDGRIYHETNQNQVDIFGNWYGHDIEVIIDKSICDNISFVGGSLVVKINFNSDLFKQVGDTIKVYGYNITSFEIDDEDLMFTVKGGSLSEKQLAKKQFI